MFFTEPCIQGKRRSEEHTSELQSPEAIRKGKEDAMKKLISVKLDEVDSITHDVQGKFTGASCLLYTSRCV